MGGVGVTEFAQEIFNAMSKTMDVSWEKEDIICFGVRIQKPYTPESCVGGDDPAALERVKKVLIGELNRIKKFRKSEKGDWPSSSTAQPAASDSDSSRGGMR